MKLKKKNETERRKKVSVTSVTEHQRRDKRSFRTYAPWDKDGPYHEAWLSLDQSQDESKHHAAVLFRMKSEEKISFLSLSLSLSLSLVNTSTEGNARSLTFREEFKKKEKNERRRRNARRSSALAASSNPPPATRSEAAQRSRARAPSSVAYKFSSDLSFFGNFLFFLFFFQK